MINLFMQASPAATQSPFASILFFLPLILIFYFLMFRPQQKRMKAHQAMLSAIVRGDTIVTNGGIIGKVTKVDETDLTVQIAEGTKVKVLRTMVADVRNRTVPANDTKPSAKK